jgi:Smg protein
MAGEHLRERVLAIVTLIAQYVMEERDPLSESDLVEELLAVGFEAEEIDAAFSWMESLSLQTSSQSDLTLTLPPHRVFTHEEIRAISSEGRGFLMRLRILGILDDQTQEEIIDKALQMAEDELTLKEVKTLTALTLFARSHEEWRREVDCFMEDDWSRLYH